MSPSRPRRARIRRAVLLAAGRGSRLRPHTDAVPKPLLPWRGRPTLDHLVDGLRRAGIEGIALVTGHLADAVDDWVATRGDASISCVRQPVLSGTADALERVADARPDFLTERFLLAATDYLVHADFFEEFLAFDAAHDAGASVSLKRLAEGGAAARSSARFAGTVPANEGEAGQVLEIVEKPAPGTAPSEVAGNLVFALPPAIVPRVRRTEASARGEREVQSALNAWLADGGRCRGLLQGTPEEWTPGTA